MSSISDLIDRYWDLAYAEGRENRQHDTKNGDAQDCRLEINDHIETLEGIAHQAGMERDELRMAIDSAEIEHGLTSNGNLWRFWSAKAKGVAAKFVLLKAENDRLRSELANARNAALEEAAKEIEHLSPTTHVPERLSPVTDDYGEIVGHFVSPAGVRKRFITGDRAAKAIRALKAEGESR